MAQPPIPHAAGRSNIPPGSDILEREPARESARRSTRSYAPPEAHEKYEVYPEEMPAGMDLMWLPTRIAGMPNPQVGQYYRAGWQPAASKDFPRISGYGVDFPQAMIDAGLLENAKPDAPIVVDDQMLVMRPMEASRRAAHDRTERAKAQVNNQMARLQQASREFRGTQIQRRFAPLPDAPRPDYEE